MHLRHRVSTPAVALWLSTSVAAWADLVPPREPLLTDAIRTSWSPGILLFAVVAIAIFVSLRRKNRTT